MQRKQKFSMFLAALLPAIALAGFLLAAPESTRAMQCDVYAPCVYPSEPEDGCDNGRGYCYQPPEVEMSGIDYCPTQHGTCLGAGCVDCE
jgi:hypothetical protein